MNSLNKFYLYVFILYSGQLGLYLSRHMEGGDSGCEDDDLQFYGMAKPPTGIPQTCQMCTLLDDETRRSQSHLLFHKALFQTSIHNF